MRIPDALEMFSSIVENQTEVFKQSAFFNDELLLRLISKNTQSRSQKTFYEFVIFCKDAF